LTNVCAGSTLYVPPLIAAGLRDPGGALGACATATVDSMAKAAATAIRMVIKLRTEA
jgi:hypothetical protein